MWIPRLFRWAIAACIAFAAAGTHAAPPPGASAEDPLSEYREKFKQGMERYRVGALSEAIGYWEPIYQQLGVHQGYRLSYNLGVAYAELGDQTRAAERLDSFLSEVDARREEGTPLGATVAKEETDARQRMADLIATKGRIRIRPSSPPVTAQVDGGEPRVGGFVAWVTPGQHTVTFGAGTPGAETKTVEAVAGERMDVEPSIVAPPPPTARPSNPISIPAVPIATLKPQAPLDHATRRPFSPVWVLVTGGIAVAVAAAAIPLEDHADSLRNQLVGQEFASTGSISSSDRQRFDTARAWAYAAAGSAIGLGTATAGLATWYLLGRSRYPARVEPTIAREGGAAVVGVRTTF
jgi:hypothetical protein